MQEYNDYIKELYKVIDKIDQNNEYGPMGPVAAGQGDQGNKADQAAGNQGGELKTPYRSKGKIESNFEEDQQMSDKAQYGNSSKHDNYYQMSDIEEETENDQNDEEDDFQDQNEEELEKLRP